MVPEQFGPTSATWTPLDTCILRGWATWFTKEDKKNSFQTLSPLGISASKWTTCRIQLSLSRVTLPTNMSTSCGAHLIAWVSKEPKGWSGLDVDWNYLNQSIGPNPLFLMIIRFRWLEMDQFYPTAGILAEKIVLNFLEAKVIRFFCPIVFFFNKRGFYFSMKWVTTRILLFLENINNKSFGCTI